MAAANIIQANDKKVIGVDGFAGANTAVPPAGLAVVFGGEASGVMIATQGVAN